MQTTHFPDGSLLLQKDYKIDSPILQFSLHEIEQRELVKAILKYNPAIIHEIVCEECPEHV